MTLTSHDANIVEILNQSNDIVVGTVGKVTDGIDEKGIPYTEINVSVSESIRGYLSGTYTFRQFGLLAPRITPDGKRKMMPAPAGFPKYQSGQQLVLFLRPEAAWTGFRMPAGVTYGKFELGPGRVANEMGNAGLFDGVMVAPGLASDLEKRMMTAGGPVNPDTFLSFVRKAVHDRWVKTGRMTRVGAHGAPQEPPRSVPAGTGNQAPSTQPPAENPSPTLLDPKANSTLTGSGK